jgi:glycosyltransferase involved in cell wall biosynthesis
MPAASVIVSTYNRPHHLVRCLEGFRHQTVQDFEILVADDGSGPETAAVIQEASRALEVPVRHVWQEDQGFRKCRVLNEALRAAESDYQIYTDSDCVPAHRFIEMHLRYRQPGRMLVGRSVKWGDRRSQTIDARAIARGDHEKIGLRDVWDNLRGRNRYIWLGIYLPGDWGFRLAQRIKTNRNTRGGNMSAWTADLRRVNGWNEDFESWGLEDVEIGLRLRRAGLEGVAVTNKALNFHLWHPEGDKKSRSARNAYNATKAHGQAWCPNGLVRAEAPSTESVAS